MRTLLKLYLIQKKKTMNNKKRVAFLNKLFKEHTLGAHQHNKRPTIKTTTNKK